METTAMVYVNAQKPTLQIFPFAPFTWFLQSTENQGPWEKDFTKKSTTELAIFKLCVLLQINNNILISMRKDVVVDLKRMARAFRRPKLKKTNSSRSLPFSRKFLTCSVFFENFIRIGQIKDFGAVLTFYPSNIFASLINQLLFDKDFWIIYCKISELNKLPLCNVAHILDLSSSKTETIRNSK